MTSKERILGALNGTGGAGVPLTTWCFGFQPPDSLRWRNGNTDIKYWYSKRMEHLHTLPQPWTLEDDFKRAKAWLSLGIDDILDVSVPWSMSPEVTYQDSLVPAGQMDSYPVRIRDYKTPAGPLRHAVRQTQEDPGAGWVIQPDVVPLIEDYNIPRALRHIVTTTADVAAVKYLYQPPDAQVKKWFAERMGQVQTFAQANGVLAQAWTAFGVDAVVWLMGAENAVMTAIDDPAGFDRLLDVIAEADRGRTELAAAHPAVDMVVQRGWYSSTDFWSPALFDRFFAPRLKTMTAAAHRHGKKFGYVMTTGVETMGSRLADTGVDLLYFVDPLQDRISLSKVKQELAGRMTVVGGINSLTLKEPTNVIRDQVRQAIDTLGPTNRFILHPVDAIFPDTPWQGVEALINAWKEYA